MKKLLPIIILALISSQAIAKSSTFNLEDKEGDYAKLLEKYHTVQVKKNVTDGKLKCFVYLESYKRRGTTAIISSTNEEFKKNPLKACMPKEIVKLANRFFPRFKKL